VKLIPLTKGYNALIDDEDYEKVSQFKWCVNGVSPSHYGIRVCKGQRGKLIHLHRFLMNAPDGFDVDHIDGDTMNNQKSNLRICTRSQNSINSKKKKGLSKFKGVHWLKDNKKWRAKIMKDGKSFYLGCFTNEAEAAAAYNNKAKEIFGNFARLNDC